MFVFFLIFLPLLNELNITINQMVDETNGFQRSK